MSNSIRHVSYGFVLIDYFPLIMFFDKPDNIFIECQIMYIKLERLWVSFPQRGFIVPPAHSLNRDTLFDESVKSW